jgi:hypothetical protein
MRNSIKILLLTCTSLVSIDSFAGGVLAAVERGRDAALGTIRNVVAQDARAWDPAFAAGNPMPGDMPGDVVAASAAIINQLELERQAAAGGGGGGAAAVADVGATLATLGAPIAAGALVPADGSANAAATVVANDWAAASATLAAPIAAAGLVPADGSLNAAATAVVGDYNATRATLGAPIAAAGLVPADGSLNAAAAAAVIDYNATRAALDAVIAGPAGGVGPAALAPAGLFAAAGFLAPADATLGAKTQAVAAYINAIDRALIDGLPAPVPGIFGGGVIPAGDPLSRVPELVAANAAAVAAAAPALAAAQADVVARTGERDAARADLAAARAARDAAQQQAQQAQVAAVQAALDEEKRRVMGIINLAFNDVGFPLEDGEDVCDGAARAIRDLYENPVLSNAQLEAIRSIAGAIANVNVGQRVTIPGTNSIRAAIAILTPLLPPEEGNGDA